MLRIITRALQHCGLRRVANPLPAAQGARRGLQLLCASALLGAATANAAGVADLLPDGQPRSHAVRQAAAAASSGTERSLIKSRSVSKLHAGLDQVMQVTHQLPRSLAASALKHDFPRFRFADGGAGNNAMIALTLTAKRDAASLAAVLSSLGASNIATYGRVVGARVPVTALEALAQSPELLHARPAMAETRRGNFVTQGDFALRTRFIKPPSATVTPGLVGGPTGLGVRVGVLSDSFACNTAATINPVSGAPIGPTAANDLATGEFAPVTVLKDLDAAAPPTTCADGLDEGRAMIQLIADVAPDSTQSFYTAFDSEADFANGILALRAAGADIVVDDVGYFDEPYFQDGIVAQAAQAVFDDGGMYFSSAGNSARLSYEAPFQQTTATIPGIDPNPSRYHNFAALPTVNTFNNFRLAGGQTLTLGFQWDEPYASASPSSPGSASDVDIYLVNAAGTVVAASVDANIGGDPFEILNYVRPGTGAAANFRVVINVFEGPSPTRIKWVSISGQVPTTNGASIGFNTNSGTATGHAAAAGAFSAGAAPFFNTIECGAAADSMEAFSSFGGTPILFSPSGTRLPAPVIRNKPDAVGPDGGNTSFFLSRQNITATQRAIVNCQDNDNLFNNFFGTSASAPHLAGVAALLRQAAPQATNAQIYAAMRDTARDITAAPAAVGFDFQSGTGYVRADLAYAAVVDTTPNAFAFTALSNIALATSVSSNTITVSGITAPAPITVIGGSYSVNGGDFVSSPGSVTNGNTVTLRQTSSATPDTTTTASLSIGGTSASWLVTTVPADTVPDALVFAPTLDAPLGSLQTSNTVTVTGINAPTPISVVLGSYSVNGGSFVTTPGTVNSGDTVRVQQTASATPATTTTATLSVGGVAAAYEVTTVAADTTPDAFSFVAALNVEPGSNQISNTITVTGINSAASISVVGGSYSVNGGSYTTLPATVVSGDTVSVQQNASASFATTTTATLNIGGVAADYRVTTRAAVTTPLPFSFNPLINVELGATVISNSVVILGIEAPAAITVSGGEFSINGGAFTSFVGGVVNSGDTVRVRQIASLSPTTTTVATLTVDSFSAPFRVTTVGADTTPNAFSFVAVSNAPLLSVQTSNSITVLGINQAAPISVSGGSYSINGGAFTTAAGTVTSGQQVAVRQTASANPSTTTVATLNIGGVTAGYSVTTVADTTPNAFAFTAASNVPLSSVQTSNAITVSGIDAATPISVTGGSYSINGAAFTTAPGSVLNGQQVSVRQTASASFTTTTVATLTIGGVSAGYSVTTLSPDTTPDAFSFGSITGVLRNTVQTSAPVILAGINVPTAISVAGGEYSVNGSAFKSVPAVVLNGDRVVVRGTSSNRLNTTTTVTVTVGDVSGSYAITTRRLLDPLGSGTEN